MRRLAALAVLVPALLAQPDRANLLTVTAVRHWSLADITRIAVEISGDFTFRTDRLHNPERVYFDIVNALPRIASRRLYSEELKDVRVKRIRVAETLPGVTRIVLELGEAGEVATSQLANPYRLMIEVRSLPAAPNSALPPRPAPLVPEPRSGPMQDSTPAARPTETLPIVRPPALAPPPMTAVKPDRIPPKSPPSDAGIGEQATVVKAVSGPAVRAEAPPIVRPTADQTAVELSKTQLGRREPATAPGPKQPAIVAEASKPAAALPSEFGKAAKRTSDGGSSLVRALGLKLSRVVIDPGHGGHDQGTEGPHGLLEKDLVLDVSLRLGKLIEERIGAEVIFTRSDDTFIPLERRTALANENKADLFLSIHANSSPLPRVAGVETFYLNITGTRDALDVASRENASSEKSVFELADLIQRIAKHDKAEESREFAGRIQTALYAFSVRNVPNARNRGIKTAPFVVLIGANMPSILAEIGFLTNPREESLLKKPDYRQKVADALCRGVQRYADSLSHFQVAQAPAAKPSAGSNPARRPE